MNIFHNKAVEHLFSVCIHSNLFILKIYINSQQTVVQVSPDQQHIVRDTARCFVIESNLDLALLARGMHFECPLANSGANSA